MYARIYAQTIRDLSTLISNILCTNPTEKVWTVQRRTARRGRGHASSRGEDRRLRYSSSSRTRADAARTAGRFTACSSIGAEPPLGYTYVPKSATSHPTSVVLTAYLAYETVLSTLLPANGQPLERCGLTSRYICAQCSLSAGSPESCRVSFARSANMRPKPDWSFRIGLAQTTRHRTRCAH